MINTIKEIRDLAIMVEAAEGDLVGLENRIEILIEELYAKVGGNRDEFDEVMDMLTFDIMEGNIEGCVERAIVGLIADENIASLVSRWYTSNEIEQNNIFNFLYRQEGVTIKELKSLGLTFNF